MKKLSTLALFLLLSFVNLANDSIPRIFRPNVVKISVLSPFFLLNNSIHVNYERVWNRRTSSEVGFSVLLPSSLNEIDAGIHLQQKGLQVSAQQKFYWSKKAPKGLYNAIEFVYHNSTYRSSWGFTPNDTIAFYEISPSNNESIYTDSFKVHKQTYSFNLKVGYQIVSKKGFVVDFSISIGLRYKNVYHTERQNIEHNMLATRHPNLNYYSDRPMRAPGFSFTPNIRLGWNF